MEYQRTANLLMKHEGFSKKTYLCTEGYLTIGYGRNLEGNGITEQEAKYLLKNDIDECFEDLKELIPGFEHYTENRQSALIDMRFNLGHSGFRKFEKMLDALRALDFKTAAKEMERSRWYYQVRERAKTLIAMIEVG